MSLKIQDPDFEVREMTVDDIELLLDYYYLSTDDHLVAMGVDLNKIPTRVEFKTFLLPQIAASIEEKKSYALIWFYKDKHIGHSNANMIKYGDRANMHLHIWNTQNRKRGMGLAFVKKSLPFYFKNLELKTLYCEPYAYNPAPNQVLEKLGFEFQKCYTTIPGSINFEQEVNQWTLTSKKYRELFQHPKK